MSRRCFPLLCLLLLGCGYVPSETKLVGLWEVDLPTPQKLVYSFKKDHTFSVTLPSSPMATPGTWRLDDGILTITYGELTLPGMTNAPTPPTGTAREKHRITWLTATRMSWRTGPLGGELNFKRFVFPPAAPPPAPPTPGPR